MTKQRHIRTHRTSPKNDRHNRHQRSRKTKHVWQWLDKYNTDRATADLEYKGRPVKVRSF